MIGGLLQTLFHLLGVVLRLPSFCACPRALSCPVCMQMLHFVCL
jgi:hypothetical protein